MVWVDRRCMLKEALYKIKQLGMGKWNGFWNFRAQFLQVEMGPDPTRTFFWPAVNKRPTRLWTGCFLTLPDDIFFYPKGKLLKNLIFLGEIFQIHTQTKDGWPDPTRATIIWPDPTRVKNFCFLWPATLLLFNGLLLKAESKKSPCKISYCSFLPKICASQQTTQMSIHPIHSVLYKSKSNGSLIKKGFGSARVKLHAWVLHCWTL